jgi:hypothetical protein
MIGMCLAHCALGVEPVSLTAGGIYHPLFAEPDGMGPDLTKVTDQILDLDS